MTNSLVGRDAERAELERRFAAGARLVTLLGPAGVGKTRLAADFAQRHRFVSVDLRHARTSFDACRAIAHAAEVHLPESSSVQEAEATLCAKLEGRALLLDNFEQLLPEGRTLAAALSGRARLLVTSRERLHARDEVILDLAPLDPESARVLFLARLREVRSSDSPGERELEAIDQLCHALDFLPLALELAAPRLRLISAPELLSRLTERFELLAEPERSLAGALEWSWSLLEEAEQRTLAQCTIFAGDFGLEAAEAVLSPGNSVVAALQDLRDKSLLYTRSTELGARFGLYGSIREYVAQFLAANDPAYDRHAEHYLARGLHWAARAEGPNAQNALAYLMAEQENVLGIHRRALLAGHVDRALKAALVLQPLLIARGPAALRLELLDGALRLGPEAPHPRLVGWAQLALGDTLFGIGRMTESEAALRAAEVAGQAAGDQRLVGRSIWRLAEAARTRGILDEATTHLNAALEIHKQVGDRLHEGRCLVSLGATALDAGQIEKASELLERALEQLEEVHDHHWVAHALVHLAALEEIRGQSDEARELYRQAIEIHDRSGNRRNLAAALGALGALETELGNLDRAQASFERALEVSKEVPDRKVEGLLRLQLGVWHERSGDRRAARAAHRAALSLFRPIENDFWVSVALAHLAATESGPESARERLAEARATSAHPTARALIEIVAAELDVETNPAPATFLLQGRVPASPLLRRAMERLRDAHAGGLPARALVVSGSWFKLPGGQRVDVGARRAPAAILLALANARVSGSNRGLSVDELFSLGWPGDRASTRAAASRVYVAVSTLRKLGLADLIIRDGDGYHLDPSVPIALR